MTGEFLSPQDPRWRGFLSAVSHDFYHLPAYAEFAAKQEGGEAAAFYVREGQSCLLIPLVVRPLPAALQAPASWLDAVSPYGYPSPLLHHAEREEDAEALMRCFVTSGCDAGIVSAFLRFHPLLPFPMEALSRHGEAVHHGETVYVDLTLSDEAFWSGMRLNHRRGVRRLSRDGFAARVDDWSDWESFIAIYSETMDRLEAQPYYRFGRAYFDELRAALGDRLHLCSVLSPSGDVAAAGLFTTVSGVVGYHLGGTAGRYLAQAPTKLMFNQVRSWARNEGARVFHLGGGLGGASDSLFHFKSGFSPLRSSFHTGRIVFDQDRYRWLCRRSRAPACDGASGGYFPAYRKNG